MVKNKSTSDDTEILYVLAEMFLTLVMGQLPAYYRRRGSWTGWDGGDDRCAGNHGRSRNVCDVMVVTGT